MIKKLIYTIIGLCIIVQANFAQIVTLNPATPSGDSEITVTFNAKEGDGNLVGADKVYMHAGVVTDSPSGTAWNYVVGNWGQDDGIGQMTKVDGQEDQWELTLSASARQYFAVPEGVNMFRLAMVFRSADGETKGTASAGNIQGGLIAANGDIYQDLSVENYVRFTSPTEAVEFVTSGTTLTIAGEASANVSQMTISLDQGEGFVDLATVNSGNTITHAYQPEKSFKGQIKIAATVNGEEVESIQDLSIVLVDATKTEPLPNGVQKGINYDPNQNDKVTFVLEAPNKEFVLLVGDITNWQIDPNLQFNKTPDGELFWLQIDGLTPNKEYVFQYWVDGVIKIGDPYAEKIADPWNDQYITEDVYPNLPSYNRTENGIAFVVATGQEEFQWAASEAQYVKPKKEELVIYELLVRDFVASHKYKDVIDTLDYLQNLGVNAIELMPIMEFEGNESWGYNPMYFFAPDKYYGSKNDLKEFIQECHARGIAVVLDMVLNHAFGSNPMVKMYFENNKPSAESPWFNVDATHPFNVGYDFNHESTYTQDFVDSVNHYWLSEYHFDGYRFDLSKGFTQVNNPDNSQAWSNYDQSRIDLLSRMSDAIWVDHQDAYVILEHFAASSEEDVLAEKGMILWRNMNYAYHHLLGGDVGQSFDGADALSHVSYMESHDEQRQLFEVFNLGQSNGQYNTRDTLIALERLKTNAAFLYLQPGPKMLWQFGELGYDIDINLNGRTGNKPLPWGEGNLGYYESDNRKLLYDAFAALLALRKELYHEEVTAVNGSKNGGAIRTLTLSTSSQEVLVLGNFGLSEVSETIEFPNTGLWFNYLNGQERNVEQADQTLQLAPGELLIYTSEKKTEGFGEAFERYENPVVVNPTVFYQEDQIKIVFDASKANPTGTAGLVGAEKVYMHAGVILDSYENKTWSNVVGNLVDDGLGQMTKVPDQADQWEITLSPMDYFGLSNDDTPLRIAMYFRDADNTNLGKGFKGRDILVDIEQAGELITIEPESWEQTDEIKIIFDARQGSKGLANETSVYMHSGVTFTEGGTMFEEGYVIGNWGQDDGLGKMTRSSLPGDKWEITLTPSEYYGVGISRGIQRLAFVFRSADGSKKGVGIPGFYSFGEVIENGDIFYDVPNVITSISPDQNAQLKVYPNPTENILYFKGEVSGNPKTINIYNAEGRHVDTIPLINGQLESIDLSGKPQGLYILRILTSTEAYSIKVLKR